MAISQRVKKFGILLFALGVCCLMFLAVLRSLLENKSTQVMERYEARMGKSGRPMRLADFDQGDPPVRGAGPVLEELSSLMLVADPAISADGNVLLSLALDDPTTLTQAQRDLFIRFYEDNPDLWDMWRRLAQCDGFDIQGGWTYETAFSWSYINVIKNFRFALGTSNVLVLEGRTDEAVAFWTSAVQSGRMFQDNSVGYLSFAIGSHLNRAVYESLQETFQACHASPEQCRILIEALDHKGMRQGLRRTMEMERLFQWEMGQKWLEEETTLFPSNRPSPFFPEHDRQSRVALHLLFYVGRPLLRNEVVEINERSLEWESVYEAESWEWNQIVDEKGLEERPDLPPWKVLNKWTETFYHQSMGQAALKSEAISGVLRLSLAARIWQVENGTWPERLDQLAPVILESIPVDPFTGQPFRYAVSAEGFLVESAGTMLFSKEHEDNIRWVETADIAHGK